MKLPPRAVALSAAVLFGLAANISSCGDDEGEGAPPPTPPPDCESSEHTGTAFVDQHPSAWGLARQVRIEVYVADSLFTKGGWYPQTVTSYYLVEWADLGDGLLAQTETPCQTDVSTIWVETVIGGTVAVETVIPDSVIASVPPATWTAGIEGFISPEGDPSEWVVYTLSDTEYGPQYWVMGAVLEDPVSESCPSDPNDPREWDQDGDNNPGVTTEQWVQGDVAHVYLCSRTLYRLEPAVVCDFENDAGETTYQVSGGVYDVVIDQSLYGSDDPSQTDPESRWSPNDYSFYVLRSLPDGATCADVLDALRD